MAAYNGEMYITEQIDSIINQSYENWELIIRDDDSTDTTVPIIEKYTLLDPRISILRDNLGNNGQCANFDSLMKYAIEKYSGSTDVYYMFTDQDDYWKKDKLQVSLEAMLSIEDNFDKKEPILVYSNYEVSKTTLDNPSLVYTNDLNYSDKEIASRLLVQNWVMGCTIIINRELLLLSAGIPAVADNHDNWIAVLCSLVGHLGYVSQPTMIHRLHFDNVTANVNTKKLRFRIVRVLSRFKNNKELFKKRYHLYLEVEKRLSGLLNPEMQNLFLEYKKVLQKPGLGSVITAAKNKFFSVNRLQTILFFGQLLSPRDKII